MATIDSRFFCTSDLDTYYVDNASGLPLSGGIVTFYSDTNRTSLKPVYQLTGTPGSYTFQPLPNPCTLSSSGTFQDALGNNIVPYYYPFTGIPDDNTGVQELYYVTVQNSGFVPQFVREGWPPGVSTEVNPTSDSGINNYIPNGQFLSHNNWVSLTEPPITQYAYMSQTVNAQPIAQGGWNFIYTNGTTATFNNSFSQIPSSGGWGTNNFPKFLFTFFCTSIGDTPLTRDLRIQWPDVNKFSSGNPPGSQNYTLYFDAKSNDSNSYTFALYKIYYFGTGGTPSNPVEEFIANITIGSTTLTPININNIVFSTNLGTIGTNGDDYVALSLRGPASTFNVSVSDFLLTQGNQTFTSFPVETNDQMLSRSIAGWVPTPDPTGMDLYLPTILTPQGMTFDHSIVGQIITKTQLSANAVNNELLMDGSTYVASKYSALGIPYQRLMNYLMLNCAAISVSNGSSNSTLPAGYCPMFGTGPNFVTVYVNTAPGNFDINFNTSNGSNSVNVQTSGFTIADSLQPLFVLNIPSVPSASTYFSFTAQTSGPLTYNVWFSVNGVGTAPTAPSGANIQVALVTGDTVASTILKIAKAVNGYQFQLTDWRGYFLRCLDPSGSIDPNASSRTLPGISDNNNAWTGANLGSQQSSQFASHNHSVTPIGNADGGGSSGHIQMNATNNNQTSSTFNTGNAGSGNETRPTNIAVYYYIKY